MKILFLAWNYPPAKGGIEYVARHLVSGLKVLGEDVRIIARHSPCPEEDSCVMRPARPGLLRYLWFALWSSVRLFRDFPADLVVCPGLVTAPVARVLSAVYRKPFVLLAHGSDVTHKGLIYRLFMRFFFNAAAGVCCNSESTRVLMNKAGCKPSNVRVIHPGVNTDDYPQMDRAQKNAIREAHKLDGKFVLLALGRLIRRKGVLEFVDQVMPDLVSANPDVLLVVGGGDAADSLVHREGMMSRIRQKIAEQGLEHCVRLLGSVDDASVRNLHQAADVHILPALKMNDDVEGFGIVLLEAALAQVPVVATRVGGIPEAVPDGETGLLAEPGDWRGLSERIQRLMGDEELRRTLGRQGRVRALTHFAWPVIAGQYDRFFQDILTGRKALQ